MQKSKRLLAIMAVMLVAALVVPVIAQAATIYVNSGVSGAKLGMRTSAAVKKLGKVKKTFRDPNYDGVVYARCFGKKSHGRYALTITSNSRGRVIAFVINSSRYRTKKAMRVGSSLAALKKAYGSKLVNKSDYWRLKSKSGETWFWISGGKVTSIWIWK